MLQVIRRNFRYNQSRCVQNNLVNIDATRINNGEEPYCLMSQFVKLADSNLKSKKSDGEVGFRDEVPERGIAS